MARLLLCGTNSKTRFSYVLLGPASKLLPSLGKKVTYKTLFYFFIFSCQGQDQ